MAWKIITLSSALVLVLACSDEPGGGADAGGDGSVDATGDTSTGDTSIPDSSSDTAVPDTSVTDSATGDTSVADAANDTGDAGDAGGGCARIESEYSRLTTGAAASCSDGSDCQILFGQCGVGLGGCHHAVNNGVTQEELNDLGRMYGAISCSSVVCRCAPPPTTVACIAGTCIAPAP